MINDLASRIFNIITKLMLIVMVVSTVCFGIYVSTVVYGGEYNHHSMARAPHNSNLNLSESNLSLSKN